MSSRSSTLSFLKVSVLVLGTALILIPAPAASDFSMATGHGNVTMPLIRQYRYIYTPDGRKKLVIMDGYSLTQTDSSLNLDNVERDIQDTLDHIRGRESGKR